MLDHFFLAGDIPAHTETGEYVPWLVVTSYIIASLASYAGLLLATRIFEAGTTRRKHLLHVVGACTFGLGIWSMHFIGMLAYQMRMEVHYDPFLTVLSLLIAIALAFFALLITQTKKLALHHMLISAVVLGLGICAMHYTGMAAMIMHADIRYIPVLFFLSVMIAITASTTALWIIFNLKDQSGGQKSLLMIVAALVMGIAICGMHYIGIAAAVFVPHEMG